MSHTPTPWSARLGETFTIRDGDDNQLAILTFLHTKTGGRRDSLEVAANARRIVACVNACEGLSTAHLENTSRNNALAEVMIQRDELLAACIEATSLFDNYPQIHEMVGTFEVLHSAIARATEKP